MCTSFLLFGLMSIAPTTQGAASIAEMKRLAQLIEEHPAENLPAARVLFDRWCKDESENNSLVLFRQRRTALHMLRDEITRQLRSAGRDAVDKLVAEMLDGESSPNIAEEEPVIHAVVPAEQLYRHYLPYFQYALDSRGLQLFQKEFLKTFYNVEVRAAVSDIMRIGRSLAAARDAKSFEVEYYLLLLPLLHDPADFSVESLRELPSWMLAPEHLRRLADFCLLRVGRLDAAEAIVLNLKAQKPTQDARAAFRLEAADQCAAAHQPGLGVDCLKAALPLFEPHDHRVVEIRFKICDVWARAKNWALAAGEAGRLARDLAGSSDGGKATFLRIKYLAAQGDAQAILQEIDDAIQDAHCETWLPKLQYYKWKALRQAGKGQEAGIVLKQFLNRYPGNPDGAEMYFSVARDCLSAQRYDEALTILESLKVRYPESSYARQANQLVERLYQMHAKVDASPASRPGAL